MAHEKTVPLLPCRSIDEMAEFYEMLGFTRIYYQVRPNPYVSMKREDLQLDFFGMPEEFKPEDSYGTCVVIVPDTGELFQAFAEGDACGPWEAVGVRDSADDSAAQAQERRQLVRVHGDRSWWELDQDLRGQGGTGGTGAEQTRQVPA
ncbi:hypothetical protein [Kibdelosporangium aridum]|uniref:hypothetical protein n=1 Tax=Kibdelosporangium aridum TaxID=2030 RepID=UPI0035E7236B